MKKLVVSNNIKASQADLSWDDVISDLHDEFEVDGIDSISERTPVGDYISDIMLDVEDSIGIRIQTSAAEGRGFLMIPVDINILNEQAMSNAIKCLSSSDFKKEYKNQLKSTIREAMQNM